MIGYVRFTQTLRGGVKGSVYLKEGEACDPLRNLGIEIPEFDGNYIPDDLLDWLNTVEHIFKLQDIPDKLKVKLVKKKLQKKASLWWEHVNNQIRRVGKSKVETWDKMKKLLLKKFVPIEYLQEQPSCYFQSSQFYEPPVHLDCSLKQVPRLNEDEEDHHSNKDGEDGERQQFSLHRHLFTETTYLKDESKDNSMFVEDISSKEILSEDELLLDKDELESRVVVRDDVNQEEECLSNFYPPQFDKLICLECFSEDIAKFDEYGELDEAEDGPKDVSPLLNIVTREEIIIDQEEKVDNLEGTQNGSFKKDSQDEKNIVHEDKLLNKNGNIDDPVNMESSKDLTVDDQNICWSIMHESLSPTTIIQADFVSSNTIANMSHRGPNRKKLVKKPLEKKYREVSFDSRGMVLFHHLKAKGYLPEIPPEPPPMVITRCDVVQSLRTNFFEDGENDSTLFDFPKSWLTLP